jgi:LacI family transcriptional regulator
MSNRPTISDVAKQAGLSVSTVDRVLNSRAPVKGKTASRVLQAAATLGYQKSAQAAPPEPEHTAGGPCRLGILLQNPAQPFYQQLTQELKQALHNHNALKPAQTAQLRLEFISDNRPRAIARQISELARHCDALALTSYEHPLIQQAIEQTADLPIFALLSELSPLSRHPYIGLDNRKVGRTAGWAMAQLGKQAGKVGIFVGSHRFVGHELREMGFRSYCREHAPQIEVLEPLVSLDDADIAYRGTQSLLSGHPDLCGIYVASGGMEGVIRALREAQVKRSLCVITQEMTPDSRQALIDGVVTLVVATPLRQLASDTLAQMLGAVQRRTPGTSVPPTLPFVIHTAENC